MRGTPVAYFLDKIWREYCPCGQIKTIHAMAALSCYEQESYYRQRIYNLNKDQFDTNSKNENGNKKIKIINHKLII